jgi:hypothetical protein
MNIQDALEVLKDFDKMKVMYQDKLDQAIDRILQVPDDINEAHADGWKDREAGITLEGTQYYERIKNQE